MAVTTTAVTVTSPYAANTGGVTPWQVNAYSADASGCEVIVAAPATGSELIVARLVIYIGAAITVTIGSGASVGAVETTVLGPLGGAVGTYVLDCRERPIQLTAAKALTFDASGAGVVCVYAEGWTRAS